jgi:drug/metabolite transporter (DMT)-like permease
MQALERKLISWGPVLIFLAAMLWATDAPFRFHLTRTLDSSFIVLAEHFINVLLILPFVFAGWAEIKALNWKQWLAILLIGVGASAVASILFTMTFSYVNPSVAIVLQKLQPLIAITLAALCLKEMLGRQFWLWAVVALAGAYVISFPGLKPELYSGEQWNPNTVGVLLALGAAVLWGLGTVLGRYALGTALSFKTLTSLRFLIAFLFLMALNFRSGTLDVVASLTGKDILFIIIVAITSGFTSLFLYYKGLQTTKASIATLAELGFPFLAVIVNAAALGLFLSTMQIVGMILLLVAVWGLTRVNAMPQRE